MLFKISLSNIRKSIKDYAVYFFTLVLGVAIFYVFNAIETQTAFIKMNETQREIINILTQAVSGVSVFVAIVLGLLIVYASRFLMKRRNKEFALYMMLGMSKWRISALLLCETVIIGIGSLVVGILIGTGLSQVMSAVVANMFEADMNDYRFTVSASAITKTIIYFGIMYVVVMLRSGVVISKCRLITLMNSGRRSEKITMKNPWLCVIVFLISAAVLGWAYYMVGWDYAHLNSKKMLLAIALGAVSTFFIFWSVAGMLLRVIMSAKGIYHRGLNSFTFRQISSKVNTTVASMTVICLMLFVTICTLSTAFTIRNSLNKGVEDNFPADFYGYFALYLHDSDDLDRYGTGDIDDVYAQQNMSIYDDFGECCHFHDYADGRLTLDDLLGDRREEMTADSVSVYAMMDFDISFLKLSDYNALMKLYGMKQIELADGEYAICANASGMPEIYDKFLEDSPEITSFGKSFKPSSKKCIRNSFYPDMQPSNTGAIIVPDSAVSEEYRGIDYFVGNYSATDKKGKEAAEKTARENWDYTMRLYQGDGYMRHLETRIEAANDAVGIGAIVTFLGIYIGFIFLVSCGAILALKELSESADSLPRYTMLRKLGVEEKEITKSIFRQSGIFFLLPLLLACLHSYVGMRFGKVGLSMIVGSGYTKPILFTAGVLIMIYGGYFLLTFLGSKAIVKEQK
ncbi:MAG: ABC transporter permease [Ruminococcus sp.]|uniref:FtsX-like permease family protein n=1 Tax=Ruminococcus sp. TaxID=41978 RepID=UPI0025D72F88|nr:ABC transporter permease [Ruminococcus sp.]MBR5681792.1 ABC transporter permease [Ruminococcus sp.]